MVVCRHLPQDAAERRAPARGDLGNQLLSLAGEDQLDSSAIARERLAAEQTGPHEPVTGSAGAREVNVEGLGNVGVVHTRPGGSEHQNAELGQGDGVADRGDRLDGCGGEDAGQRS